MVSSTKMKFSSGKGLSCWVDVTIIAIMVGCEAKLPKYPPETNIESINQLKCHFNF